MLFFHGFIPLTDTPMFPVEHFEIKKILERAGKRFTEG
jgi:hypothetical protein